MKQRLRLWGVAVMLLTLVASCRKEQEAPESEQLNKVSLDVSAEVSEDQLRSLGFELVTNGSKVNARATLKGRSTVKVYTYLYSNGALVWKDFIDWKVSEDGRSIKLLKTDITPLNPINPYDVTMVAAIAGDTQTASGKPGFDSVEELTIKPIAPDDGQQTKVSVVFTASASLIRNSAGRLATPPGILKFEPLGAQLRIKVKNPLNRQVTISGLRVFSPFSVLDYDISPRSGGWNITRIGSDRWITYTLSEPLTLQPGATSDKNLLVWLSAGGLTLSNFYVELICDDGGRPHTYIYAEHKWKNPGKTIRAGKLYSTTLTLGEVHNPLLYVASHAMRQDGTDFVTDHNIANPNVGFFTRDDAIARFTTPRTYPRGGSRRWHIPSEQELNAITGLYTYIYGYWERVKVGDYQATVAVPIGQYRLPRTLPSGATVNYAVRFASTDVSNGTTDYPAEQTQYRRFAFRYFWDPATPDVCTVTAVYVGARPDIYSGHGLNESALGGTFDWNTPGALSITIPWYPNTGSTDPQKKGYWSTSVNSTYGPVTLHYQDGFPRVSWNGPRSSDTAPVLLVSDQPY